MNVLSWLKFYFTRLGAQLAGTQHGEISRTILYLTIVTYLACQIVVSLNRNRCSIEVFTELHQAKDRLHRVESSLESLEKTVVKLLRDKERTRIAESVLREAHSRSRRQVTRTFRSEIRYLKRKMKLLERRLSVEVRQLRFQLSAFKSYSIALETSLKCLNSANGTDSKGRPCIDKYFHIGKGGKVKETKRKRQKQKETRKNCSGQTDNTNSTGHGEQKDSRGKADQRKRQGGTTRRRASRRNAVFIRWGTSKCRTSNKSHTSLVYAGRVALPNYRDKGGGSNYLCMPERAFYTNPGNISNSKKAYLYPVKYGEVMTVFTKFLPKVIDSLPPEKRKLLKQPLDYKDVPCAVCRVEGATTTLMIPAHNYCPSRFDRQYHGYLMSQAHNYGKSEFVCVDVEAEGIPNTKNPNGDAFLHLTEYKCGSSFCNGYRRDRALSCAVCTT